MMRSPAHVHLLSAVGSATRCVGLLGFLALLTSGCVLEDDSTAAWNAVTLLDTLRMVDTVRVVDTVVALGDAAAAADDARGASGAASDLSYLRSRRLIVPVAGIPRSKLPDTFDDLRGSRRHNAMDILAPRGTPVLSVDDGRVVKLHTSVGGGLTIYATDPRERFIYYYAHLDRYRAGIAEEMRLAKGDTIGYVGSTGNATTPHLHFAIARADADKSWWSGTPVDPLPILRGGR